MIYVPDLPSFPQVLGVPTCLLAFAFYLPSLFLTCLPDLHSLMYFTCLNFYTCLRCLLFWRALRAFLYLRVFLYVFTFICPFLWAYILFMRLHSLICLHILCICHVSLLFGRTLFLKWLNYLTFNLYFKICQIAKFCEKVKLPKFGTKNALLVFLG